LFGIPVKYFDRTVKLRVKELVLPSHTAQSGNYNPVVINQLRDVFLSKFGDVKPHRRIYISRMKAKKRKVANEDEVIALLDSFNYEIHYFEDYSFDQQVSICSESLSLIGLHGAGLTNMLFMRPGTQVLELRNENDCENNCYFSLASDLNIAYFFQLSKGDQNDTHTVNVNVDVNELRRNIESMIKQSDDVAGDKL
jgi:capsular polysaccharide biosynthesis protein